MRWHALGATIALFWAAPSLAQTPGTPPPATPAQPAPAAATAPAAPAAVPATPAAPAAPAPEAAPAPQPEPMAGAPSEPPAPELPPAPAALPEAPSSAPVPSPADMEKLLDEQLPPPVAGNEWSAPSPVITLHGYLRARGELMDTFWLGRRELSDFIDDPDLRMGDEDGQGPDPFSRFRPVERRAASGTVAGDADATRDLQCADEGRTGGGRCDVSTLQFANMRFRLAPELALSEDVRIKSQIDVFDNLVFGEPPVSYYGVGPSTTGVFVGSDVPPQGNALGGDSIRAKAAWAEVRNRDIGELRFGRMPQQWGLGMLYNGGGELDDDQGTYLDRVLGITKIEALGLYLSAGYDFAAEGYVDPSKDGRPLEQSQLDDLDQFTLSAARRRTDEERAASKEKGELTLEGGIQLQIRNQDSRYLPPTNDPEAAASIRNVGATVYTTDVWGRLAYRGLRIEAELAWASGTMDDVVDPSRDYDVEQLGYVIETELRVLDERLGLYLDHGLASGDSDVEGLSSNANFVEQLGPDHDGTVSTFRFHPSYRVDLILWRNIMTQVTGALYVRPGISYDFMRDGFGQLFGARLDFVWSRATAFVQTWGNDPDLGVEANLSLYYRTEDGPDLTDGFHTTLQYGVLFPLRGLDYRHREVGLDTAQTLRLLLGVVY